jgi:hypothetical protein
MTLNNLLPAEIWANIWSYDDTYRSVMSSIISNGDIIKGRWQMWRKKFNRGISGRNRTQQKKLNFMLSYVIRNTDRSIYEFAGNNISIYFPKMMLFYTNYKHYNQYAVDYFDDDNFETDISYLKRMDYIEVCLEFETSCNTLFALVLTKAEFVMRGVKENENVLFHNDEFYLIEDVKIMNTFEFS